MNSVWLKYIFTILSAVPGVVTGVETIVTGAKQGATKKDLAMASLGLAKGAAESVAPEFAPMIEGASALASVAIDSTVAFANLVNKGKAAPSAPAPAPAPASVPDATGTSTVEGEIITGPGLHNVVSA